MLTEAPRRISTRSAAACEIVKNTARADRRRPAARSPVYLRSVPAGHRELEIAARW